MSTFRGKEAALGKEGEQEVEEIMWVPSLILFLTQSLLWVLSSHIVSSLVLPTHCVRVRTAMDVPSLSHIVSHLVSHVAAPSFKPDHTLIVYVYEQLWRCPPPLIPAPIFFLAQSLWDGGKERFVAYGPSPASS